MKFLIKLMACFLIAWLPLVGYSAQAPLCSDNTIAVSSSHEHLSMTDGSDRLTGHTQAPCVDMQTACQTSTSSPCCGTLGMLALPHQFIAAMTLVPTYRPMSRVLNAQFVPEPPDRPPQAA
jgi:hypothetical protein